MRDVNNDLYGVLYVYLALLPPPPSSSFLLLPPSSSSFIILPPPPLQVSMDRYMSMPKDDGGVGLTTSGNRTLDPREEAGKDIMMLQVREITSNTNHSLIVDKLN